MKLDRIFLMLILMLVSACSSSDEPTPPEPAEEKVQGRRISYAQAVLEGLPCMSVEEFNTPIYASRKDTVTLSAERDFVSVRLQSMAKVRSADFKSAQYENWGYLAESLNGDAGFKSFCIDEDCFVFFPYTVESEYMHIVQTKPDVIEIRLRPNGVKRKGIHCLDVARSIHYLYGPFDEKDTPVLFLYVKVE